MAGHVSSIDDDLESRQRCGPRTAAIGGEDRGTIFRRHFLFVVIETGHARSRSECRSREVRHEVPGHGRAETSLQGEDFLRFVG